MQKTLAVCCVLACSVSYAQIIVDHTCTDIAAVPQEWVEQAKADLHIAYGHTSHGSQVTSGMSGLVAFMNGLGYSANLYAWNNGGTGGALDLRDTPFSGASDLGNPNWTAWEAATRTYLDAHPDVNVVIWSWCGQVSGASAGNIDAYLTLMDGLESDYPGVTFVYMTGHLDGSGLTGNLHLRNEQIRTYCRDHGAVLFDFADIETYNPDGDYFGDKHATDGCNYDANGNGTTEATGEPALPINGDANWAIEWQGSHEEGTDWYTCGAAHSQPLNANRKAYAAWWLWARIAGWDGTGGTEGEAEGEGEGEGDNGSGCTAGSVAGPPGGRGGDVIALFTAAATLSALSAVATGRRLAPVRPAHKRTDASWH